MNPLQSAFQNATQHLAPIDRCTTCGAPDPDGQLVVIVTPDADLADCPECARPVDRHGRPCGRPYDGSWIPVKVVCLPEAPEWVGQEVVGAH